MCVSLLLPPAAHVAVDGLKLLDAIAEGHNLRGAQATAPAWLLLDGTARTHATLSATLGWTADERAPQWGRQT